MIDRDATPGPLTRCQVCGSQDLRLVIDLGHQPPCDALVTDLNAPETTYPLRLMQCLVCTLAQLDYVVPARTVYPDDYPYKAGISWPVVAAHKEMAQAIVDRFGLGLCVDIGSNDGTLLAQLKALGCGIVGVEPTNIADIANAGGVPTVKAFFTEAAAREIVASEGRARVITMTNVFAHMGDLGEVMRGVSALLADDGVLVIENHYLLDVLERNQFDTIYHEHVRTYTLGSLIRLFEQYGMVVFDVERMPRYGGNIRVYVGRKAGVAIEPRVGALLSEECARGVSDPLAWRRWRDQVYVERYKFAGLCHKADVVIGCSAPGRASTLLNFYGVTPRMMPWTGELRGSMKVGKYVPGCHVPIVSNERIGRERPEYLVLLAWHYAKEIIARLRKEGCRSKLVVPLPNLEVIE